MTKKRLFTVIVCFWVVVVALLIPFVLMWMEGPGPLDSVVVAVNFTGRPVVMVYQHGDIGEGQVVPANGVSILHRTRGLRNDESYGVYAQSSKALLGRLYVSRMLKEEYNGQRTFVAVWQNSLPAAER